MEGGTDGKDHDTSLPGKCKFAQLLHLTIRLTNLWKETDSSLSTQVYGIITDCYGVKYFAMVQML